MNIDKIKDLILSGNGTNIDLAFQLAESQGLMNELNGFISLFAECLIALDYIYLESSTLVFDEDSYKYMNKNRPVTKKELLKLFSFESIRVSSTFRLAQGLEFLKNVKFLDFRSIKKEIDIGDFINYPKLDFVNIGECNIKGWNKFFDVYSKSEYFSGINLYNIEINEWEWLKKCKVNFLRLGYIDIFKLPDELFSNEQLMTLHLDQCKLKEIPSEISKLKSLENICLNGNNLTDLPESLSELPVLEYLNLSDNKLNSIPSVLYKLNLKELNIKKNKIPEADILNFKTKFHKCKIKHD